MKDYLKERIKFYQKEYAEKISTVDKLEHNSPERQLKWEEVALIKAKLEEVKEINEYFKENNYENA